MTRHDNALALRRDPEDEQPRAITLTPEDVVQQTAMIQQVMSQVMHEGEHFGTIPGTQKPTLYKAGVEKLFVLFQLAPSFDTETIDLSQQGYPKGHRECRTKCTLRHRQTGAFWGDADGSCSTLEEKYRWRQQERSCPKCGAEAVIKGKEEYGGGWICFRKKAGCGAKWPDGAAEIEGQTTGRVENPNLADTWNTVMKMAEKRAAVAAGLFITAASDLFTQDVEDLPAGAIAGGAAMSRGGEPARAAEPMPSEPAPRQDAEKPASRKAEQIAALRGDDEQGQPEPEHVPAAEESPEVSEADLPDWPTGRSTLAEIRQTIAERIGFWSGVERPDLPSAIRATIQACAQDMSIDALTWKVQEGKPLTKGEWIVVGQWMRDRWSTEWLEVVRDSGTGWAEL